MTDQDQKVRDSVVKAMKRLISEGKDLLAGSFIPPGWEGVVSLDITSRNEHQYDACYTYKFTMWNFVIDKSEL